MILPLLALVSSFAMADGAVPVAKQEDAEFHETHYGVNVDGCILEWTLHRDAESHEFGFSEKSKCNLPIDRQMRLRSAMLDKVSLDTDGLKRMRGFSWGRIERGDANDEFARRFTVAVAKSPSWDKSKGKLVGEAAKHYSFLPNLMNDDGVFSELATLFAEHKLKLKVTDVEKVFVGKANIPGSGIAPTDNVPIDCSVVFSVSK